MNPLLNQANYSLEDCLEELKKSRPSIAQMLLNNFIKIVKSYKNYKVVLDDNTAFGMPHHDHSFHIVYIDGLNYEEAKEIKRKIEICLNTVEITGYQPTEPVDTNYPPQGE